ncbi:MAG TPA: hypothetical protein VF691_21810 [Cytophagaceae bacterium]|jgi:hypothetical protein
MLDTREIKWAELEQRIFDKFFDEYKHVYPPHFPNITVSGGKREKHGVGLYSLESNSVVFILQLCNNTNCEEKIKNVKYHLENQNLKESFICNCEKGTWLKFTHTVHSAPSSFSDLLNVDLNVLLRNILKS